MLRFADFYADRRHTNRLLYLLLCMHTRGVKTGFSVHHIEGYGPQVLLSPEHPLQLSSISLFFWSLQNYSHACTESKFIDCTMCVEHIACRLYVLYRSLVVDEGNECIIIQLSDLINLINEIIFSWHCDTVPWSLYRAIIYTIPKGKSKYIQSLSAKNMFMKAVYYQQTSPALYMQYQSTSPESKAGLVIS